MSSLSSKIGSALEERKLEQKGKRKVRVDSDKPL